MNETKYPQGNHEPSNAGQFGEVGRRDQQPQQQDDVKRRQAEMQGGHPGEPCE